MIITYIFPQIPQSPCLKQINKTKLLIKPKIPQYQMLATLGREVPLKTPSRGFQKKKCSWKPESYRNFSAPCRRTSMVQPDRVNSCIHPPQQIYMKINGVRGLSLYWMQLVASDVCSEFFWCQENFFCSVVKGWANSWLKFL